MLEIVNRLIFQDMDQFNKWKMMPMTLTVLEMGSRKFVLKIFLLFSILCAFYKLYIILMTFTVLHRSGDAISLVLFEQYTL